MAQDMFSTTELVNKIFDFCYLLSGKEMFSYQAHFSKRIIRAVIENDSETLTALMSRQSGKSFTVSNTVAGLFFFLSWQICQCFLMIKDLGYLKMV